MGNLDKKEEEAILVLKKAYEENDGKLFLSFSGGKDSTILRHLALKIYPDLPIVFSNTTNELSEIIKYVKTFPNIITVNPTMPFKKVVEKYGFPIVSKEVSQKANELKKTNGKTTRTTRFQGDKKGNGKLSKKWQFLAEQQFDVSHKCCQILKKDPLNKWAEKQGLKPIIALMEDESLLRQQLSLYGADDGKKIYPFLRTKWTEEDIWEYAEKYNIRFAECYYDREVDGKFVPKRVRTGCEYCAFGITLEATDRFERSKITAPKKYEKMMNLENNGVKYKTAIDLVKKKLKNQDYLGLYGFKPLKGKVNYPNSNLEEFELISTTTTKKCPHCESKKIKDEGVFSYCYSDLPGDFGLKRNLWVNKQSFQCNDCKKPFDTDMHMFNNNLMITKRLEDYILSNKDKKSFEEVEKITKLSFEKIFEIVSQKI